MARNRRPRIRDQEHEAREGEPLAVQVIATDRNPGDTLTYRIVSGNGQGLFQIDPLTGIISRADGGVFDFETDATRYDLRVRVTDDGNPPKSRTGDVTIRITDAPDAPHEITLSNLSVDENAVGATVGIVTVADQDDNTHSLAVDDARFEIVGGVLRLKAGLFLDHETGDPVTVTITATDDDGGSLSQEFTVTVNDLNEAPAAIALSNASVDENAAGAAIGTITVTDPDDPAGPFGAHTVSVDDARFEIVDGVLKLVDGVSLDHEAEDAVTVTITATDGGGLVASQTFTIAVGDVNEAPTAIGLSDTSVDENVAGAVVGILAITDPDDPAEPFGSHALTIDDARFEIVGNTLKLVDGVALDHETTGPITVTVTATDGGGAVISQTFDVTVTDINEAPTAIGLSNAVVGENAAGAVVGSLAITDPDDPLTPFGTHDITVDDARFEVVNGVLKLKDTISLDHEAGGSVPVVVTVTDGGGASVSQAFDIAVTDANDAPTSIALSAQAIDEATPGAVVGTVLVADPDDAAGMHDITVSDSRFEVVDGVLKLKDGEQLDFRFGSSVSVVITATDGGGLSVSQSQTIIVNEIDEAPVVEIDAIGTVAEEETGVTVGQVIAFDPDQFDGTAGPVTISVDDPRFEVVTGLLKLRDGASLDFETEPTITLTVTATDDTGHSVSQSVTLTVRDVLDGRTFIDLGALDGGNGVTLTSALPDAYLGLGVSGAGDVNGDGYADVIVSAPLWDDPRMSGAGAGAQFVLFGKAGGWNAELDLSALDGTQGFRLSGAEAYANESSSSVAAAGDINGDGYDDIIVTSLNTANLVGVPTSESYVVFGGGGGFPADIDLSALDGSDGFRLVSDGTAYSYDQMARGAGDLNGDGIDDLVVTVDSGLTDTPQTYVVYGSAAGWSATVNLGSLDGSNGFGLMSGSGPGSLGDTVAGLGDVNGDGYDDIIVGGPAASAGGPMGPEQGDAFVVFGGPDAGAVVDVDALDGSNGFTVTDSGGYDFARSLSGGGDINGDGIDDFVISRPGSLPFLGEAEGTYAAIVYGQAGGWGADFDLAGLDGSNGFWVHGEALPYGEVSVSIAGDLNGDGYDDVLVGSPFASVDGAESGSVYVVYGGAHGLEAGFSLDTIDGYNGFRLDAADPESYTGFSVSGAGDVNGDGFDDLLVGAPTANQTGWQADGEAYIVFGGDSASAVTMLGTDAADTLAGTAAADSLVGAQGDDVLTGAGGADVLYGGAGDDVMAVADTGFARIDGGSGTDTLRLDGAGHALDLTAIGNAVINGVEKIDLTGSGDNAMTLAITDLLNLSDESNDLFVAGDSGDRVDLVGDWRFHETSTVDSVAYNVFGVDGVQAALYVEQDVEVTGPAAILLGGLDGTDGTTFTSDVSPGFLGAAVSAAGDVNGDGYADIIVGQSGASPNGQTEAGSAYVVFGGAEGWGPEFDLSTLDGSNGFRLNGANSFDGQGSAVSTAGDINGDGYDDLIIGGIQTAALAAGGYVYEAFVVFGAATGWAPVLELTTLDGSNGFRLVSGETDDDFGQSVASAGDINGDGLDDLIVGTSQGFDDVYVLHGQTGGWTATVDMSAVPATDKSILTGDPGNYAHGRSVAGIGDINGDGFNDVAVGAPKETIDQFPTPVQSSGVYVFFGNADGLPPGAGIGDVDGSLGVRLYDSSRGEGVGIDVSAAGDVNGDGIADMIVGSQPSPYDATPTTDGPGYVVFGRESGWSAEFDLNTLDGSDGFRLNGLPYGNSRMSVASAGDVNGDGFDDLIVGAPPEFGDVSANGEAFVVYGKAGGFDAALDLTDLDGVSGFRLVAADVFDFTGFAVSGAGDVNGDGFDDLVVGAPLASDSSYSFEGEAYVVYGGDFTGAVSTLGTDQSDVLAGTAAADGLIGAQGDDILVGNGGADVLHGGQGDDILAVGDLDFGRIDGGTGNDTLRLDGAGQSLDLTAIGDTVIDGIERIDLTGAGDNSATLAVTDLLQISDSSSDLFVAGDAGDQVTIIGDWQNAGPSTVDGVTYDVFSVAGIEAALYVEDDVTVTVAGVTGV